ncbi:RNA polymerase factor sigma-54 [Rhizosphaericola mali]|uniref:RNA polymerase factor sigma-54 n=1 Tax=Rhizosphaericola mali TaxID=2545455 RepID=A0A5P2FYQ5_9BACT|nr:RNA polymerase factor sigma-54 [Rhizosphaericola mali]QES88636.1 RNA polymerase factor sigma-54 [Rhizosphaericola mali]
MALSQALQQKQLQKLSPQQIQLMKLLQIPTANLEERIKEEMEENPALETNDDNYEEEYNSESEERNSDDNNDDYEMDGGEEQYDNIDISEYVHEGDDEVGDYKTRDDNYGQAEEKQSVPFKLESNFHDTVVDQLGMLSLKGDDQVIAEQIVGSLDDDGYLRRDITSIVDDLAFRQNIDTTEANIERIIKLIQKFDPAGICARDLKECLILQLERIESESPNERVELAMKILQKYFDEFTKKHYEKILRGLDIDDEKLKSVINVILHLNPKPGGNIGSINKAESYIVPDFFIFNNNGQLELTLNSRNAPALKVSEGYRDMLKDYERGSKKDKGQKDAVLFIKQKIDSAKWFIDMIKQRQNTLLSTMTAIMQYQENFFLSGDETNLKPMILKDIAEITALDISTVSRVANSKFVQTEFGTYRLKFFFSESLSTDSGEEVSTREVKKILSDVIEEENKKKPLSDERLTTILQEKGYNIARRTVAKYREQLNIPVARLRKEL